ncbi:Receptor-like protein CLAVATA2 [Camellia lanceoleosa]|uniref:Receptor-like protein CLAVATA2 n=1 Tax=Camellia lanceoleosa TaxID=1840588 RepID=A0ACC0IUG2_9ERIC|nr:Receptor-like protein CLAVATA2 [Camellia lanceoleosa]
MSSAQTHLYIPTMEERWVVLAFWTCKSPNFHQVPLLLLLIMPFLLLNPPSIFAVANSTYNSNNGYDDLPLHPKDRTSLLLFKSHLQDPNQFLSSWELVGLGGGGSKCTNWTGITCSNQTGTGTGRVISLNLTLMNLSGPVHPSLCNLSLLETLILSHNRFNGSIPPCLGKLLNLRTLDLGHNMFSGVVPRTLARLSKLTELALNTNKDLNDTVPLWIGNFSIKLEKLDLGFGSFRGSLSCLLTSVESISVLNLANNSIVGGIPSCISSLQELKQLNLSFSGLRFEISSRILFSDKLVVLDLSFNALSGQFPSKFAEPPKKSRIVLLDLSHNQFYGDIPLTITELKSLQVLFLSHNLLTGEIPARIGNLTYLQVIDLSHNSLSGSIPLNIVGCFQLLALILSNNNLSGEIQPELDALDSLKILDISNNKISGEIPLTLAGCKSLEVVDFSYNNLSGGLNDAITKWLNLRFISLARNKFNGSLPAWLFSFQCCGYIPDGNCNISLMYNNSHFSGTPTQQLGTSQNLQIKLSVVFSDVGELSFDYDLSSAVGIDLSDNSLYGEIPVSLFGLHGLEYLNLSYNFLDGQIPSSLEKMWSLRALDLSHNSLLGQIPENISSLGNLTLLNLSYNCFSGIVPMKQGYWRFPGAFAGNPDLCVESPGERCQTKSLPVVPGKTFEEEMEGPISLWTLHSIGANELGKFICGAAHGGGDVDGDDEPRPELMMMMKPILLKLRMGSNGCVCFPSINQLWYCCCCENCGAAAVGKIVVFLLLGKNRIVRGI